MIVRKNLFTLTLLAVAAFTSTASAADGSRVQLHVPFSFVVAGRTLPPGDYQLSESGSLFYLRGDRTALIVPSEPTAYSTASKPSLIFRRDGGLAYLVGVRTNDYARSIAFHPEHTAIASHPLTTH